MYGWSWRELLWRREAAWDHAETLSLATGDPFTDRNGNRVNEKVRDMVGLCLARWLEEKGMAPASSRGP